MKIRNRFIGGLLGLYSILAGQTFSYQPTAGTAAYNITARSTGNGGFTFTASGLSGNEIVTIKAAFDGAGTTFNTIPTGVTGSWIGNGIISADGTGAISGATITHNQLSQTANYPAGGDGVVRFRITRASGTEYVPPGTSGGSDYTIDLNRPTMSQVTISSSNGTNSTYATTGDVVTLSLTASENISEPTVTMAGQNANVSGSNDSWNGQLTTNASLDEGVISFSVTFSDENDNSASSAVTSTTDGSSVTFDKTAPSLNTVTISSDNSNNSTYAIVGDVVTLQFTSNEALNSAPNVTIASAAASVTTISATSYSATRTMQSGDPTGTAGKILFSISNIKNKAGITASNVTTTTNASSVTFDESAPVLDSYTIASNNSNNTAKAKPGNVVTVSVDANESINQPTITIAGRSATVTGAGDQWDGTYTMTSGESEGAIAFSITFSDIAGNSGTSINNATTGNDGLSVTFDKTAPQLSTVTITSSNSDATRAKPNDVITLTIEGNEALSTPTVTIAGQSANVSGSGTSWTAQYQMTSGENEGAITFNISYTDVVGNTGTAVTTTTDGSSVNFDKTVPTLSTVTIASNNSTTTLAKPGDLISLNFTSDSDLLISPAPTVTIAGNAATVIRNSATSYTATYTMTSGDVDGTITFNISNYKDLAGNTGTAVSSVTSGSNVTFDRTVPTLPAVTIASNNASSSRAKVGDIITLTIGASENIQQPTVTITGQSATVSGTDDSWSASYTMTSAQSNGTVSFNIAFSDLAGNAGTAVTTVTGGSNVTFDKTAPTLPTVTISSNNANLSTIAIPGDVVTLTIVASEAISTPTVSIGGGSAGVTSTSSTQYSAAYTMTSASTEGTVTFSIDFADLTGNSGTTVTAITGGSNVTFDKTAPTLTTVSIASNNSNSSSLAKVGNVITLTIVSDQALAASPTVTIAGNAAGVSASSSTNYTATYTMQSGDTEGTVSLSVSNYTDAGGNAGSTVTSTTNGSAVTFDRTVPTLLTVTIASDNANSDTLAKVGDEITITIVASEILSVTPVVKIAGNNATESGSGTDYSAVYTMQSSDSEGPVSLQISGYTDQAGNAGAAVTTVTSGNNIAFDKTIPTFTTLSMSSSNSNSARARVGNVITLTMVSSENIRTPTVTLAGQSASVSGSNRNWSATYTMQSGDTEGLVSLNVTFSDRAGNAGNTRTTTNDGSTITFDRTAPQLTTVSISSDNSSSSSMAVPGNLITLSIIANESVNTPTVTIAGAGAGVTANTSTNYTATYTMTSATSEGTIPFNITYSDITGNAGTAVTSTTDATSVTFDKTAPTLTTVSISSGNANSTTKARVGDVISLNMIANQTIGQAPTVTFAGNPATNVTQNTATNYTATYTVQSGNPEGVLSFSISSYTDVGGNTGSTVTSTTDATEVIVDKTAPTAYAVTSVLPAGGRVVNGYWNATNTQVQVVVPVNGADTTLVGGSVQIQAKAGSGAVYENIGTARTIVNGDLATGSVTVTVDSAISGSTRGLEEITDFQDGKNIYFRGRVADIVGNTSNGLESSVTLLVDQTAPVVSSVTSATADGYYSAGDTISIQVGFSETVNITGTLRLTLETGSLDAIVNYSNGSGTSALTFNYIVGTTHNSADLDYVSSSALALNGGTLRDNAGNNGTLTLAAPGAAGSLGYNKNLVVDTQPPSAYISLSDSLVKQGDPCNVSVDFSERMTHSPRIHIAYAGGSTLDTVNMFQDDSLTWTYQPVIPGGNDGTATITIVADDLAGNALTATSTYGRTLLRLDNTAPVFSAISVDTGAYINHQQFGWTLTELPGAIASGTITWTRLDGPGSTVVTNLSGNELQSGTKSVSDLNDPPLLVDQTRYNITFAGIDSAGNTGQTTVGDVTFDIAPPSVNLAYSHYYAAAGTTVTITATFSESILPGLIEDPGITINYNQGSGITSSGPLALQTGTDSTVWNYAESMPAGAGNEGIARITINANDLAGNALPVGNIANRDTLVVDNSAPVVTFSYQNLTQAYLVNMGKAGDTVKITGTFNERMRTGAQAPTLNIDFPGTSADTTGLLYTTTSNDDSVWNYQIQLPAGTANTGVMVVTASGRDLAGNQVGTYVADNLFQIDNTPPAAFATGQVLVQGLNPVQGWLNGITDTLEVRVPVSAQDTTLLGGGRVNIRMQVLHKMAGWSTIGSADSIFVLGGTQSFKRSIAGFFAAIDTNTILAQGDTLLTQARLLDRVGNSTTGDTSTQLLVYDPYAPLTGTVTSGNMFTLDTLVSTDTMTVGWSTWSEVQAATASGIDRYEVAVEHVGVTSPNGFIDWTATTALTLQLVDSLEHDHRYRMHIRGFDGAGNISDTVMTDIVRRWNSAPVITSVMTTDSVYEDSAYARQITISDSDLNTLRGDDFRYYVDLTNITMPPFTGEDLDISIDSVTGLITALPVQKNVGSYTVTVTVNDSWNFSDTMLYTLNVIAVNDSPLVSFASIGKSVTFVEDHTDTVQIALLDFVFDEDHDSTTLDWTYQIGDTTDNPNYPLIRRGGGAEFSAGRGAGNKREILKPRTSQSWEKPENLMGIRPKVTVTIDSLTGIATFDADSNYTISNLPIIFIATDPGTAFGRDTIFLTITPHNDAPMLAVIPLQTVNENDSLYLDAGFYATDVDDDSLEFTVTALTNADRLSLTPASWVSHGLGDSILFKPELLWSDSALIRLIVTDFGTPRYSDTVQFVLDVLRVPRPHPALAVIQNPAFTNFMEVFITDTLLKTTSLTFSAGGLPVTLDSVAEFTWSGRFLVEAAGNVALATHAVGAVGDTLVNDTIGVVLARTAGRWEGTSADGRFAISGEKNAVTGDQHLLVVDSTFFGRWFADRASYRVGNEMMEFRRPVEVSFRNPEPDLAIYQRTDGMRWTELPSLTRGGKIIAWTEAMGYFRLGPKTLIIPEFTSLQPNYPNPFNPFTNIVFDIGFFQGPRPQVLVVVYNLLGQQVRTLVNDRLGIGRHTIRWDGCDTQGVPMASGVYFVRLSVGRRWHASQKIMLLR